MQARIILLNNVMWELIGPGSEGVDGIEVQRERISESPLQRYSLGILYPQKAISVEEQATESPLNIEDPDIEGQPIIENEEIPGAEIVGSEAVAGIPGNKIRGIVDAQDDDENSINTANQYCPSTFGLSFIISHTTEHLILTFYAAKYREISAEDRSQHNYVILDQNIDFLRGLDVGIFSINDDRLTLNRRYDQNLDLETISGLGEEQKSLFWLTYHKAKALSNGRIFVREPIEYTKEIDIKSINNFIIITEGADDGLSFRIRKREYEAGYKMTLSVINNNTVEDNNDKFSRPDLAYFQNQLKVTLKNGEYYALDRVHIGHKADEMDRMLYRNKKIFAVGHGCSVQWKTNTPKELSTSFMPTYEVPQVTFDVINPRKCLDIKYLANPNTEKEELLLTLIDFKKDYEEWIKQLEEKAKNHNFRYKVQAQTNIEACKETAQRMGDGIKLLQKNEDAYNCFCLMNKAMMMQRYHTQNYVRNPRLINDGSFKPFPGDYYDVIKDMEIKWRPFQLAFILLSLDSIVNHDSVYRETADLIWFPTGGGKTEAYLGVLAFTIFYRRMSNRKEGFKIAGGITAIMRYTLRLLTAQQYQRASTLICACEIIRSGMPDNLGCESISIGLWVGVANTPNKCSEATAIVNRHINGNENIADKNPFQILYCPWCGTKLLDPNNNRILGFRSNLEHNGITYGFAIRCINKKCSFKDYLPLQVVDEEIYDKPPTLLLATADKFAMLPHKPEARSLFGLKHNNKPPELIIQDELHLISGPLGSIFGMYEAIIDYLCLFKEKPPKIISSTATIKKADDQIRALFNRDTRIFPPPGLDIEDSYFARENSDEELHGRLYVGLMSIGMTQTTGQVRLISSLLHYNHRVFNDIENLTKDQRDNLPDKYYTIVGYYNTIRELGNACSLLEDDIAARLGQLQARKRELIKRNIEYFELTSRIEASEIPIILNQLENNHYTGNLTGEDNQAIPIVLSTNMFSVGVDIGRLNLMFVCGQPKSSSEYIQSTSRVGRSDPGIVFVLYDGYRPRDKSHYENFQAFHQSFYRFVEPTSVTPFALPVRKRALHALLIILARLLGGLIENGSVDDFSPRLINAHFLDYFKQRISVIDNEQLSQSLMEIQQRINEWNNFIVPQDPNKKFARRENPFQNMDDNQNPLMKSFGDEKGLWNVLTSLRNVDIPTLCIMKENI